MLQNSILGFGKYKFNTYQEVLDKDPKYLLWAIKTVDSVKLHFMPYLEDNIYTIFIRNLSLQVDKINEEFWNMKQQDDSRSHWEDYSDYYPDYGDLC